MSELEQFDKPKSAADVLAILGQVIVETHGGKLEPRISNSVAYLASAYLSALQVADLDERLKALEARHNALNRHGGGD